MDYAPVDRFFNVCDLSLYIVAISFNPPWLSNLKCVAREIDLKLWNRIEFPLTLGQSFSSARLQTVPSAITATKSDNRNFRLVRWPIYLKLPLSGTMNLWEYSQEFVMICPLLSNPIHCPCKEADLQAWLTKIHKCISSWPLILSKLDKVSSTLHNMPNILLCDFFLQFLKWITPHRYEFFDTEVTNNYKLHSS